MGELNGSHADQAPSEGAPSGKSAYSETIPVRSLSEYLKSAAALREAGKHEQADAEIAEAVRHHGENAETLSASAANAMHRRDWAEAARHWNQMRRHFPDDLRGYVYGGRALLEAGELKDADSLLTEAAVRFPKDRGAISTWAECAMRRRDWMAAAERWERLRAAFPDSPFGHVFGGRALLEAGREAEADALLTAAVRRFPNDRGAYQNWAECAMRRQEWAEAARRCEEVRARFPDHLSGYVLAGRALLEAGREDEAEALLTDAVRRFSADDKAAEALADFTRARRERKEAARLHALALSASRQAVASGPARSKPLKYIFRGHEQAGFFAHALMLGGSRELIEPALDNLPPSDEPYLCLIPVLDVWRMHKGQTASHGVAHYTDAIDQRLHQDLRARRALLVFDLCNEGPELDSQLREIFRQLLDYLDGHSLPAEQIVWLAQNRAFAQEYNNLFGSQRSNHPQFMYYDFFIKMMAWTFAAYGSEIYGSDPSHFTDRMHAGSSKDKLLLCLNATPRIHRVLTVAELIRQELLADSLVSFPGLEYEKAGNSREDVLAFLEETPELQYLKPTVGHAMTLRGLRVDEFAETGNALFDKVDPQPYLRSFFSIVTESDFTDGRVERITEKSIKAFCLGHPALIVGNPNAISFLTELGFEDWSDVIERGYEAETDPVRRFKRLFDEVGKQVTAIRSTSSLWLNRTRDTGEANIRHATSGRFLARYIERYDRRVIAQMNAALQPDNAESTSPGSVRANAHRPEDPRQTAVVLEPSYVTDPEIGQHPHRRRLPASDFFEQLLDWCLKGCEEPGIDYLKIATVASYVKVSGYRRFVETGTLFGGTVATISNYDVQCDTIELSPHFYEKARLQFANTPNVRVHFGDSGRVLPELLRAIDEPCVFWLDGHYSEGPTAKGDKDSPILEEFAAILNHPIRDHIILIDDIRCFGQEDWPPVSLFLDMAQYYFPDSIAFVQHDILRIVPAELSARYRQTTLTLSKILF
jgi:tetratricopeptide (TPR) repeat protein